MPKFFVLPEMLENGSFILSGDDARHIVGPLRRRTGDSVTVCDGVCGDYTCTITDISRDGVVLRVLDKAICEAEPAVRVTLYAALSKGDRFDTMLRMCVELGVCRIVPFVSTRCVSRPDSGGENAKQRRWNAIAREAAGQSGRGIIPPVCDCVSFDEAVALASRHEVGLFFYESGTGKKPGSYICGSRDIAVMTGCEGGFSPDEAKLAVSSGLLDTTLGKRILRCETAPVCALCAIMYAAGEI